MAYQKFPGSNSCRALRLATLLAIIPSVSLAAACPHTFVGESTTRLLVTLPSTSGAYVLWAPSAYAKACDQAAQAAEFHAGAINERHIRSGELVPLDLHAKAKPPIELLIGSAKAPAVPNGIERGWIKQASEDYQLVSTGVVNLSGSEYVGGSASPSIRSVVLPTGRWAVRAYRLDAPAMARRDAKALYPPDLLVTINPASSDHGPFRTAQATFAKAP